MPDEPLPLLSEAEAMFRRGYQAGAQAEWMSAHRAVVQALTGLPEELRDMLKAALSALTLSDLLSPDFGSMQGEDEGREALQLLRDVARG